MKKLYRKGTVHPSPAIKPDDHLLTLLPAAILALAAALSPADREVLAYLISTSWSSSANRSPGSCLKKNKGPNSRGNFNNTPHDDHLPLFHCDCFSCYTSYWVRWDSSPSRQLIHEILDAFERSLEEKKKNKTGKKDRRKRGKATGDAGGVAAYDSGVPSRSGESSLIASELGGGGGSGSSSGSAEECSTGAGGEAEEEKGSVRRFVSFIGEKILGVWG